MTSLETLFDRPGRAWISSAPAGCDALVLSRIARARAPVEILHLARDDGRLARTAEALRFFAPEVELLTLPAWDCLPYDRISPRADISSHRLATLARLARARETKADRAGRIVLTTVNALLQRVPPRELLARATLSIRCGEALGRERLLRYLTDKGYAQTGTVVEAGEFALRGGIVDLYPPGTPDPLRLDFFGETVETIRPFDPLSQRSTGRLEALELTPVSEVFLDEGSIARFRAHYRELFGAVVDDDPLFEAIGAGRKYSGMEHWLPLFHERLETVLDYLPDAVITLDHLVEEARNARLAAIADHYEARLRGPTPSLGEGSAPYKPIPPDLLYLSVEEWECRLAERPSAQFSPYSAPVPDQARGFDAGGKRTRDFAAERAELGGGLFDALSAFIRGERRAARRVIVAGYGAGTLDRLRKLLSEHGVSPLALVESWDEAARLADSGVALTVLPLEHGFETSDLVVIGEQDIFGERLSRPSPRRRRAENFLADVAELTEGDLVVHVDHGIGRFDGLATLEVAGAPHDCLRLIYEGDDKLFVPVENIELLSRYGSAERPVALDKLGGIAWQARKSRLKRRIREMAEELIRIAAERSVRPAPVLTPSEGLYEEFCARFPYAETEDQIQAIEDTLDDLATGRPMDRLICGDVGFGKTEVALRAAFVAALAGRQVAVVVPTTLLCRQHYQSFNERFAGLPVKIEQLSRLVMAKKAADIRERVASGDIDIVIATHALLSDRVNFRDLGLLIVDEEQHFGVAHKERLKRLKSDVHVLTMTATPIPRTLQLALSGVRGMSVIATPPIDRLAIRTYILPYDPMILRQAILREHYRGGQTFYVCPRIADIDRVAERVQRLVPEVRVAVAHGRLPARALEKVMSAFYDGGYDVLVVTTIIESGLDIPTANTLILHRADMFGLAQLYQLRGRIGRSKVRAYAYLTLGPQRPLTVAAEKRLEVLHKLDSLGAGFSLASHDLDIRGAGNLLGPEQSGHIREVGIELYQHMLEQAVTEARATLGGERPALEEEWTPQINLGASVLIPEAYVGDLGVRLGLYRRIARLEDRAEIDAFAAELADRFGPMPAEVRHLLDVIAIKQLCREAAVERIEAGPKGVVLSFRNNAFPRPDRLVELLSEAGSGMRLRPDHTLVATRSWTSEAERLEGVGRLLSALAALARPEASAEIHSSRA